MATNPNSLASALASQRWSEALALLDGALLQTPGQREWMLCRTHVLRQLGREGEALVQWSEILARWPDRAELRLAYGEALATSGRLEAAQVEFERVLATQPDSQQGWLLLGQCLHMRGLQSEALRALEQADALQPNHPRVIHGLGEVLLALQRPNAALRQYRRLRSLMPIAGPMLSLRIAQCMRATGDHLAALDELEEARAQSPDLAPIHLELGGLHEDLGHREAALSAYADACRLAPEWSAPVASSIGAAPLAADASLIGRAEAMLVADGVPDSDRAILHHMLGKRDDLLGRYADAANHWLQANRLRRSDEGAFDRAGFVAQIDDLIATYTTELLAALHARAQHGGRPILIVGCPRSGSTLVEQILSAHPESSGCGESDSLPMLAREFGEQSAHRLLQFDVGFSASRYLALLAGHRQVTEDSRLIDKQPWNLLHLGLLSTMFSQARVIWCRRDPRDTALSIFSESFAPAWRYATDLDDIQLVISESDRLMRHWQRVLPIPVFELHYETLVADPEAGMRHLLAFAGLDWNDCCRDFHRLGGAVQTLSRWQVREPIHGRAIGRWRHYRQWFPDVSVD